MSDIDLLLTELRTELAYRSRRRAADERITDCEWFNIISDHLARAVEGDENPARFRANMMKAAAFTMAAVLACDRNHPRQKVAGSAVKMGP